MNAVDRVVADIPRRDLATVQVRSLTAADIRQRVNTIQEVMREVMKCDVHYGVIPGCKKPSLWKPGSEVLLATFQIGTSVHVADLSTDDCIRYRVTVVGTHTPSGTVLGEGIGECSSNEERYKWRKCWDDEFTATPETRRRIKFGKYKDKQVRTEPADVANTILKMAKKRAQIDMTLTATGASDCFDQDLEDLPDHMLPAEDAAPAEPLPPMTDQHAVDIEARCASIGPRLLSTVLSSYKAAKLSDIADREYDAIVQKLAVTAARRANKEAPNGGEPAGE